MKQRRWNTAAPARITSSVGETASAQPPQRTANRLESGVKGLGGVTEEEIERNCESSVNKREKDFVWLDRVLTKTLEDSSHLS